MYSWSIELDVIATSWSKGATRHENKFKEKIRELSKKNRNIIKIDNMEDGNAMFTFITSQERQAENEG